MTYTIQQLHSTPQIVQNKINEGGTLKEVAEYFSVSLSFIKTMIHRHGLSRHQKRIGRVACNKKYSMEYCKAMANGCTSYQEFKENNAGAYAWCLREKITKEDLGLVDVEVKNFPEYFISKLWKKLFPSSEYRMNDRIRINPYELDLYDKTLNIAIEYDGKHFHTNNENDLIKNQMCIDVSVRLIRIAEVKKDKKNQISNIVETLNRELNIQIDKTICDEILNEFFNETMPNEEEIIRILSEYETLAEFRRNNFRLFKNIDSSNRKLFKVFKDCKYTYSEEEIIEIIKTVKTKYEFYNFHKGPYLQMKKRNLSNALIHYERLESRK